ncbi:ABC transporter [Tothia fuscella]|uniref:ABC transporter n=1 Tax=Tothia fuscella TaxID=1048955 RepID=A0A9P4TSV8_9PEZI|nr:ABC transporter [Tothia fuscella]
MFFSECTDDVRLGPSVHGCRYNLDFTLKFERIVFSLVPSCLFICVAVWRISILVRRPPIVAGATLKVARLAIAVIFAALHIPLLIVTALATHDLSIPCNVLAALAAFLTIPISVFEHSRASRPSILLNSYLFLTLLSDTVQMRTLWLAARTLEENRFSALFTTTIGLKIILLLLESVRKTKWVKWDETKHSPEETSGVFSLVAFTWLNQIFVVGFKKILTLDDLFSLDASVSTIDLQRRLARHWKPSKHAHQKLGLARAITKALAVPLFLPIGPRLTLTAFRFGQPFLIHALLDYLDRNRTPKPRQVGHGLIIAAIFIYIGIALSSALYWYLHERALCMSRAMLVGVVYTKTVTLSASANDSAALVLMSTDIERTRVGFLNLHEFWANTIEIFLASWLLYKHLGPAVAAPLLVVSACVLCAACANKFTAGRQKTWMDKIEKRVGLTAGLIQSMRVEELKTAAAYRKIFIIVASIGFIPLAMSPVITFAITSKTLDVTTIFTSLSYLLLLTDPLSYIFQNTPNLIAAFACLDRIQRFLEKEPRMDYRTQKRVAGEKMDSAISIFDGEFGWIADKMVLTSINFSVPASRLTVIIGPVGSGKSTLCKALLGEVPVSKGETMINPSIFTRRVGDCDQSPYLSNGTIRENILGLSESQFNKRRYQDVIAATLLELDLVMMPNADYTKIGSNGITLSGGQKHRIAMARALYLDSNLGVFDDVFSGLDNNTDEHVFHRVLGPGGLLRERNTTIVLCTNDVGHMASADHIIALGTDGTILEQGNFAELVASGGYLRSLVVEPSGYSRPMSSTLKHETEGPEQPERERDAAEDPSAMSSMDAKQRMEGDPAVYRYYLRSVGKKCIASFVVFSLGWDVTTGHARRSNLFYIGLYALFQAWYLISIFLTFLICFRTMIQTSGALLHHQALSTLVSALLKFFATTDTGLVTNLFSQDLNLIDNELPMAVTNLALDVCNALGMAAVIATASPYLAISYPFIFVLLYTIQRIYLRTARQFRMLDLESKSPLYTHFIESMRGVVTFRAFGWVQMAIEINNSFLDASQKATYLLAMAQRWLGFVLQVIVAILAVSVVTLATQLRSGSGLTGASLVTLMTFGDILAFIIRWFTQLETSISAVSRLKSFDEKVVSENVEGEDWMPPELWPLRGGINLTGVSASYDNRSAGLGNIALNNINLSIQPGEKVALCGRSGSGKSSMILLLLRLLDPLSHCSDGIMIDGQFLNKVDRASLRQRVIAIPQDSVFLPEGSTFMANLDLFNLATEGECRQVLEIVTLRPLVDERGGLAEGLISDTLSQGQKQLFSLARALLRQRICARAAVGGLLLLDEISSSVDQETDRMMHQIIKEEFEGYTIVMVSHRLDSVLDFDTVVIMDRGSIVESGAPRMLLQEEGSRFRDLWADENHI